MVFLLTAVLATNQAGLAESVIGVAGRDDRVGAGAARNGDGQAPADAVCALRRGGAGGERALEWVSAAA